MRHTLAIPSKGRINHLLPRHGNTNGAGDSEGAIVPLPIAYAVMNADMTINRIVVVHGGGKYTAAPAVTIAPTSTLNGGATAEAKIDSNGNVVSVRLATAGTAYAAVPSVVFSGGTTPDPWLREDPQYEVTTNAAGTRILLLRREARKLLISTTSATAAATVFKLGFFNERMWKPVKGLAGARGIGNDGFTKYIADTGGIPIISNTLAYGHKTIYVPEGIFFDEKGVLVDAFVAIKFSAAGSLAIHEVF